MQKMAPREQLIPILHVSDAKSTAKWYERLGFVTEGEHQFEPGMPYYLFLRRGDEALHLSEHKGDARPDGLIYLYAHNLEEIAREFGAEIKEQPWHREVHLIDPDQNRIRVGELAPQDS